MSTSNLMENANQEVKRVFSFSKYPYLAFMDYIEEFLEKNTWSSAKVMCSFVDKGSDLENLTNIIGERMNPMDIMTLDLVDPNISFNKAFQTLIATGEETNKGLLMDIMRMEGVDLSTVYKDDSRTMTAFKIYLSKTFTRTMISSDKIITSVRRTLDGNKQILFSTLKETVIMTMVNKKVIMEVYSDVDITLFDHRSALMSRVNMEIAAEQIRTKDLRYITNRALEKSKNFFIMPNLNLWDCKMKKQKTKYQINIIFATTFGKHYINYFSDNYKVDIDYMEEGSEVMSLMKRAMFKEASLVNLNRLVTLLYMGKDEEAVTSSFWDRGISYLIDISEIATAAIVEFDFVDFEKEFAIAFSGGMLDDMMELTGLDNLNNSLMDNDTMNEIATMFNTVGDETFEEDEDIPARETIVVMKTIMRAMKSCINKDYYINPSFTKAFIGKNMDEDYRNKLWSIIYTEVTDMFKAFCTKNTVDIIFAVFVSMVKAKTLMKAPKKVTLFTDMRTSMKCIMKHADISDFEEDFGL